MRADDHAAGGDTSSSPMAASISLRPLSARSLSCEIFLDGERAPANQFRSFADIRAAAGSSSSTTTNAADFVVSGMVRHCRSFGSILFADIEDEGDTLQLVLQPSSMQANRLALPLLVRRLSKGTPHRTTTKRT